jgi:hypothetical protein
MRFDDLIFRTGRGYELVPFERLAAAEREALHGLEIDPDLYGVLRPRGADGTAAQIQTQTYKAVGRDTALLLLTLAEPGPLPAFARRGTEARRELARLVLDGVLEVGHGGGFVSGSEALAVLGMGEGGGDAETPAGALARLSLEALRYAAALEVDDLETLGEWLYGYHRLPLTPRRARWFPPGEALLELLGAAPGSPLRGILDHHWTAPGGPAAEVWLSWSRRWPPAALEGSEPVTKLYVSPSPEALRETFAGLLETLPRTRALSFKIGSGAAGVLRPDKLVVYFAGEEDLVSGAEALARRLAGVPPHGVPFSAEIAGDGLLSWGLDPPPRERLLPWQPRESWRQWVTRRLAAALLTGRRCGEGRPAWRFALERLRLEGVDVERWTPRAELWGAAPTRPAVGEEGGAEGAWTSTSA